MPTKLVRVVILGERDWGWEKGRLKFYFLFEFFYQEREKVDICPPRPVTLDKGLDHSEPQQPHL